MAKAESSGRELAEIERESLRYDDPIQINGLRSSRRWPWLKTCARYLNLRWKESKLSMGPRSMLFPTGNPRLTRYHPEFRRR